jgi:hypothetical protein
MSTICKKYEGIVNLCLSKNSRRRISSWYSNHASESEKRIPI